MKVKKIHENVLNLFTKCSLTKGFQCRYNDKDSKREDDEICQQQEKPPIWHDDVPWNGYRNDVLQFTNE